MKLEIIEIYHFGMIRFPSDCLFGNSSKPSLNLIHLNAR